MTQKTEQVAELYNRYSYPAPTGLTRANQPFYHVDRLNYVLQRRSERYLPRRMNIWVPGCGTQLAVWVALNFPESQVFGTDLSGKQVEFSADLARQLGIRNLELRVENILERVPANRYDFILCTGVLHHLEDPVRGLEILRGDLKKNGVAQIMVYNRWHRYLNHAFQNALALLVGTDRGLEEKHGTALQLIQAITESKVCEPLKSYLGKTDWKGKTDQLADTLLHPLETSFSVNSLIDYLHQGGMRKAAWVNPKEWELSQYIKDKQLLAKTAELNDRARAQLVYLLAGESSPMLELYVERNDEPAMNAYSESEFSALRPYCYSGRKRFPILGSTVAAEEAVPPYVINEAELVLNISSEGTRQSGRISLPVDIEPILRECDGQKSIAELVRKFPEFEADSLLSLFKLLLSPSVPMFAPASEQEYAAKAHQ